MTQLVLLGTGTPNACPENSGPATAVVVDGKAYIFDFGPGVVRQCSKAYFKGIHALHPKNLDTAFCTHLHTDHTSGLPDLLFTPWVLERENPLRLIGPEGLQQMAEYITKAYAADLDMRLNGYEPANLTGYKTIVKELEPGEKDYGVVYADEHIQVEAFSVDHGRLQSLGYKCITKDKTIVISGDTRPSPVLVEKAKGADILLHEVEYTKGLQARTPQWQQYHRNVHTLSTDLAAIATEAKPKLVVTYHRIYHMDMFSTELDVQKEMIKRNEAILQEIKDAGYEGKVVNGQDLDVF